MPVPRSERPLDDDGSPLGRFAADLRKLREKAGSPPYRKLSRLAHYSSTTLADAAAGRRLPSLPVTLAYVRACGGDPAEWETRWRALSAELSPADEAAPDPGEPVTDCPYVGLGAFQPGDAGRFFGRERLTDELEALVRARRFAVVFGASGSGKSSLLRAGLLPRVTGDEAPEPWTAVVLTPGPHPFEECAARLAALTGGSAAALHDDLTGHPRALHLTALQALADRPDAAQLLLVVDQFEEVFTLCADERERAGFIEALAFAARAANSRVRVVLGVRADFYAACSPYPDLVDAVQRSQLLVGPMSPEELRRAVSAPAVQAGCAVESALLARVVAEATGQPGSLPLVSHALRETWRRRRGNTLTVSGYEAAGGIPHALANTAETVHAALSEDEQRLARGIFLRLVSLNEGTGDSKRRVARDELPPSTAPLLEALARASGPSGGDVQATRITERGRSLSGGQRQRLALARSLVVDPPVLVLDEPTSAVDAHTEARIADGLRAIRAGRTTVVFTSSPLLLDRADRVVFVEDGRAAAVGTHRELLRSLPRYRAAVTREPDSAPGTTPGLAPDAPPDRTLEETA